MTRNEKLAANMTSIECEFAGIEHDKTAAFSDGGAGVERLVNALDFDHPLVRRAILADIAKLEAELKERFENAVNKLILNGLHFSIPTLLKIMRNRGNRQASIREMMAEEGIGYHAAEAKYFRHRNALLEILDATV